jgi:hypothetical protein
MNKSGRSVLVVNSRDLNMFQGLRPIEREIKMDRIRSKSRYERAMS